MSDTIVKILNLRKAYRSPGDRVAVQAINGLEWTIGRGEVWALAGPNGAGKTTTFNCMLGLIAPDSGSVQLFGENPIDVKARRRLGFQSEIFFSYPYLTPVEAMEFYGRLSDVPAGELDARVNELLERVGLGPDKNRHLGGFSKGMMQRLGLAQSLIHDPEVVVWDEPSTGLDPEGRRVVINLLEEFKRERRTVILSTHILSDVERVCDHLAIMHRGKLALAGKISDLLADRKDNSLENLYLETVAPHD